MLALSLANGMNLIFLSPKFKFLLPCSEPGGKSSLLIPQSLAPSLCVLSPGLGGRAGRASCQLLLPWPREEGRTQAQSLELPPLSSFLPLPSCLCGPCPQLQAPRAPLSLLVKL